MVNKKTWQPNNLWPPAPFPVWFAPGGGPARAASAWGEEGLDVGSLRTAKTSGTWEIFMGAQGWVDFDPADPSHMGHANRTSRYGAGQSFGEGLLNGHSRTIRPRIEELLTNHLGRKPTSQEVQDVSWNRSLAGELGLLDGDSPVAQPIAQPIAPQGGELIDRLDRINAGIVEILAAVRSR